jgi:threonine dehydratase
LTNGVSFGFGVTRISASSAMAENSDPFLRFSIGEESESEMQQLCHVVIEAVRSFLKCEAHCE